MARTFKDMIGEKHNLDHLLNEFTVTVDADADIVSGEISGYCVLLDDEQRIEVNEETYNALKKIL